MELSNWVINDKGELCTKMNNSYMIIESFGETIFGFYYVYKGSNLK